MTLKGDKTMKRMLEQLELSPSLFRDLKMKRRKLSDYVFNDTSSVVSADSGISGISGGSSCAQDSSPNSSSCSVHSPGEGNDCDTYSSDGVGESSSSNTEEPSDNDNDAKEKAARVAKQGLPTGRQGSRDQRSPRSEGEKIGQQGVSEEKRDEGTRLLSRNARLSTEMSDYDGQQAGDLSCSSRASSEDEQYYDLTSSRNRSGFSESVLRESGSVNQAEQAQRLSDAGFNMTASADANVPIIKVEDVSFNGNYQSEEEERPQMGRNYQYDVRHANKNSQRQDPINMTSANGVPRMTCTPFPVGMPWSHARVLSSKQDGPMPPAGYKPDYSQIEVPVVSALPVVAFSNASGQMMTFPILNVNFREGDNKSNELVLLNASGVPCGKVAEISKQESQVIGSQLGMSGIQAGMDNGALPNMTFQFKTDADKNRGGLPVKYQNGAVKANKAVTLDWNYLSEVQRLQAEQIKGNKDSAAKEEEQDEGEALTCDICNDRATGLHYGIITCEGCKGFFKRTVQNKRVYTCVGNGNCVINKAQRNRCQFCRFKKCMDKGMILAAVREDRMPGGRNSGAIYNAYKAKYKRQKKREENVHMDKQEISKSSRSSLPLREGEGAHPRRNSHLSTNYREELRGGGPMYTTSGMDHMRPPPSPQDSLVTNPWKRTTGFPPATITSSIPYPQSQTTSQALTRTTASSPASSSGEHDVTSLNWAWQNPMSNQDEEMNSLEYLLECEKQDSVMLYRLPMSMNQDISQTLCKLADDIVCELVLWMKKLPIYDLFSPATRTSILTNKWHELLVLSTSVHHAEIALAKNGNGKQQLAETCRSEPLVPMLAAQIERKTKSNMEHLHQYLTVVMKQEVTLHQLYQDLGDLVEKITICMHVFEVLCVTKEEFVCLKVILLLNQVESQVDGRAVHDARTRHVDMLKRYHKLNFPDQPNRLMELMYQLPRIRDSAEILLKNRLIYIPFLFNSVFNWQ